MDEEAKKRVAEFRFGVIHDLIGDRKLSRGERRRLLREKSSCIWEIPFSRRSYIGSSTIIAWARRYEKGGRRLDSLYPEARSDRGRPRALCHAEFYLNEKVDSYIEALRKALKKRGLPRKLYVDNGPAFRSDLLRHATASLGIALIHSKPFQPQGRGKIERFFGTVRRQFLVTCPEEITLEGLNERLRLWVDEQYHEAVHSSTRQTPLARYLKHAHLVREAPKDLDDHFRMRTTRKVDRDRTVSLNGRLYEAPVTLIGRTVTLLYHEDDPARVEVLLDGDSHGMLVPLDVKINCKVRRRRNVVELLPKQAEETPEDENRYKEGRIFGGREEDNGI